MSNILEDFDPRWRQFLQNPAWYVAAVVILAGLVFYIHLVWWLAGAVALVWGIWLIWQMFGEDTAEVNHEEQLNVYLDQARLYQAQLNQALEDASNKSNAVHQQRLVAQINIWVEAIQDLVQRIAGLRQDTLICQDMAIVPQAIENLEAQLAGETDAATRAQLERALKNRRNQLTALALLQRTIKQAEIKIENTLSLLGTIYSQILTGQSTNHVADYSRLSAGVDEEVGRLQDQLEALREVKGSLGPIPFK